jgi:hypothetical protein
MRLDYPSLKPKKKGSRRKEETEKHLTNKWGYWGYEEKFEKVQELLEQFGTEEFIDYLNHSGLGDYSTLIEKFYDVAVSREKALQNPGGNLYDSMAMAEGEVKDVNQKTREDLNKAFSNAYNNYIEEHGDDINTALPQTDLFIIP